MNNTSIAGMKRTHMCGDLRLKVARVRHRLSQRFDASIRKQQLRRERRIGDVRRFVTADDEPQVQERARFLHRIVDAHRGCRAQLRDEHGIIRNDLEPIGRDDYFSMRRGWHGALNVPEK